MIAILLIIATKSIKYLRINLTEVVTVYKSMIKEIQEDTNGKTFYVHESENLVLLKQPYYSKQSTDLQI